MESPSNKAAAAILDKLADIDQELGGLLITVHAENLALQELLPNFRGRYEHFLNGAECQQLRVEFEKKIRGMRKAAQQMSEP